MLADPGLATVVNWLDAHGAAVTALATVILCGLTGLYAAFTYMLVRDERRRSRDSHITYGLEDDPSSNRAILRARNLGPASAIDLTLRSGPRHDIPDGVTITNLGPASDLPVGESREWAIEWEMPRPKCDIWLTLSYLDNDALSITFRSVVVRIGPEGAGTSAGWGGTLGAKGLKRLARKKLQIWQRPWFRLQHRRKNLHELLVEESIREAVSQSIGERLDMALQWEPEYRKSFGRL